MRHPLWNRPARAARPRRALNLLPACSALESRQLLTTSATPFLVPLAPGVNFEPLITVGEGVPETSTPSETYRMVGIPDGMGAFDNGDGTFTLLMNHELRSSQGTVREHGSIGAFVSKWIIDKDTRTILSGDDLIQSMMLFDSSTGTYVSGTTAINRLCSADLPSQTAFFNPASGLGTQERIFMNGEEAGAEGRAFGTVVSTGTAYELPYLGKFSWENSVASPFAQDKTIVIGLDDSSGGQLYVYIGNKQSSGSTIDRAGLSGGTLYGVAVNGTPVEDSVAGIGAISKNFALANLGDASTKTGAQLEADSTAAGVTKFLRPEDGHWDPAKPNDFYWVTTNGFGQSTRLWRLRFTDVTRPELGGRLEVLINSPAAVPGEMYDNITVDSFGNVIIQEDPGGNDYLAKIAQYNIASKSYVELAESNPDLFAPGGSEFRTNNEESSGVIDLTDILGPGYYMVNLQAQYPINSANPNGFDNPDELVAGGQLLIMNTNAPTATLDEYGTLTIDATVNNDQIEVSRDGKEISVVVNGQDLGTFDRREVSRFHINGSYGDDVIGVAKNVKPDAIILGGFGNDFIQGGGGRNILIGGAGVDVLMGSTASDLLVGGSTTFDDNVDVLDAVLDIWSANRSYQSRVNGVSAILNASTIKDDLVVDFFVGGGDLDLFFVGVGDLLTDRKRNEIVI